MLSVKGIQNIYANCLNRAVAWLRDKGYTVNPNIAVTARPCQHEVIVETTEPLYCSDWPYRRDSGEKVDILASIAETISLKDGTCRRASISVNYFRIEDRNTVVATESLRYDCVIPPDEQHPICHVQTSNKLLDPPPQSFTLTRRTVKVEPINERCQAMRIPSAFVNLPGLLTILAADHMTNEHWAQFMQECLSDRAGFSRLKHCVVDKVLREGLCAWAWYEDPKPLRTRASL